MPSLQAIFNSLLPNRQLKKKELERIRLKAQIIFRTMEAKLKKIKVPFNANSLRTKELSGANSWLIANVK